MKNEDTDEEDQHYPPRRVSSNTRRSGGGGGASSSSATNLPYHSPAQHARARELIFTVEYLNQEVQVEAFDSDSVRQLKEKIYAAINNERVHPTKQRFTNWTERRFDDNTLLSSLHLPKQNTIHLVSRSSNTNTSTSTNGTSSTSLNNRTTGTATTNNTTRVLPPPPSRHVSTTAATYVITVQCGNAKGEMIPYDLHLSPKTTIAQIKSQIETLVHIPVQEQVWNGLQGTKDHEELGNSSIERKAKLVVRRLSPPSTTGTASSNTTVSQRGNNSSQATSGGDRSDDEPMDITEHSGGTYETDLDVYDHDILTTGGTSQEPLIPDKCTNETVAQENFTRVFQKRFVSSGPILYMGPLEEAIRESLHAPIKQRRPLAIYLHHERSVCANVFCSQVLASELIVDYLASNYTLWAWDLTFELNRIRLLQTFKRTLGGMFAERVAHLERETFPIILLLSRSKGSFEFLGMVEGKHTPDECLTHLMTAHDMFNEQRQRDEVEETQRETRENLKRQQEDEYHMSKAADMAKIRAREDEERKKKQDERDEQQKQRNRLEEQKVSEARLPPEPSEGEAGTTRLKIRLPDDEGSVVRRFRMSDPLQTLFDYLTTKGHMTGDYKLLTTFPRRDLTQLSKTSTLEEIKLSPQEQLILESVSV